MNLACFLPFLGGLHRTTCVASYIGVSGAGPGGGAVSLLIPWVGG